MSILTYIVYKVEKISSTATTHTSSLNPKNKIKTTKNIMYLLLSKLQK